MTHKASRRLVGKKRRQIGKKRRKIGKKRRQIGKKYQQVSWGDCFEIDIYLTKGTLYWGRMFNKIK